MDFQTPTLLKKLKSSSKIKCIKVLSPAKINLYLNIVGKYKNGFHKIESIANRVSIFDEIIIAARSKGNIDFFCNYKDLENKNNLCVRAASLLKKRCKLPFGFTIFLKKNIPVGSGLGGASSNAAYTLLGINKLLKLGLSTDKLCSLGQFLGSDVNFFIHQTPWAYLSDRGQNVKILDLNTKFRYLIVYPKIRLSTRLVYEHTKVKLTRLINNVNILSYALKRNDLPLVERCSFNCLEKPALEVCNKLKNVKEFFRKKVLLFFLTGSGSAFFSFLKKNPIQKQSGGLALVHDFHNQGWLVFEVHSC